MTLVDSMAAMPASPTDTVSAHGVRMPVIGFGTGWMGPDCVGTVARALACGYRHIDTARKYGTERGVGEAIRASGVPRDQLFVTTKVSDENLRADDFARSVDHSLEHLGLDAVDLLLIHWPNRAIPLRETIGALAKAKRQGLARHIGVANFTVALLDEAVALCPEPLVTNQVEHHPYLDQSKVRAACRRHGLILTGYCPLGRGRLPNDPVLAEIGRHKGKTAAQVALRWALQQDRIVPIPRSTNPQRIAENIDLFDFTLSAAEMARISALARPGSRIADPAERAPDWDA
jgi:diketogulonate reductase-like aldo/keto reductase